MALAATANYSVVVEEDARWLPAFVKGERTVFVAAGSVDAGGDRVAIELRHATLSEAVVDPERSRVASRNRGLLDGIGGVFADSPTADRPLFLAAARKLDAAARADDALVRRAERNTRAMLERLLAPLGFERVTVTFV